ncbi:unnamed protein product [Cladocopium goreaui]|uniref:Uncharacterized protein n=1 Tax=Cladocopium goreaui TaxID=2562237 RepID=A0A9P1GCK7_9DINO|nr:unnamed protein product [Cladocopium goreaui]|mmetsp:Transcript_2963/g.6793  ORF Transcript_2963/g.6793 Transcript_2963/m.6793 type:complete len:138 (-) Transcript_2963:42-455(-)
MGKVTPELHSLMVRGGFRYDAKKDKYFMAGEAEWDRQKRIDKGKKQYAVPASTVEEFHAEEEKMVDSLLERLKKKAGSEGRSAAQDDGEEKPKKAKRKQVEEEEEEEEEDAEAARKAKKAKKAKAKQAQEEEEEEDE